MTTPQVSESTLLSRHPLATILLSSLCTVLCALLVLFLVLLSPSVLAQDEAADAPNLLEAIEDNPEFSTLEQVLRTARIEDSIAFTDNISLLAPTNNAFEALPETVRTSILQPQNQDILLDVLRYHVVLKPLDEEDLNGSSDLITLLGPDQNVSIVRSDDRILVNGEVLATNFSTDPSNGTLVTIDTVLLPEGFDAAALQSTPEDFAENSDSSASTSSSASTATNAAATATAEVTPRTGGFTVSITVLGLVVLALASVFAVRPLERKLQITLS